MNATFGQLAQRIVNFCGRLQFKVPALRKPVAWLSKRLTEREGTIWRGVGKGLRFDATGGYPGYLFGTSEPVEQALVGKLLGPGAVFYDIGANIGFYSTIAARIVGRQGKVFAFEPFPESARACRNNALRNRFEQVKVMEVAVGAKSGETSLAIGESTAVHRMDVAGGGLSVRVVSIDEWRTLHGEALPNLVMIDIEGAEIDALIGMQSTIEQAKPVLMVEVHWLGEAFTDYCASHLLPLGYRLTTYTGEPIPEGNVRYHALLMPPGYANV